MPDLENAGAPIADDASGAQPAAAQPSAGVSGDWLDDAPHSEENALFGDLLREGRSSIGSTSKPGEAAPDGESTPIEGDVKPSDPLRDAVGRFIPRRGVPEAVKAAEAKAAEAEAKAAELDPAALREQVRAEIEAERQQKADADAQAKLSEGAQAEAERYERLLKTPDHEMTTEDYQWREDRKALLAAYPQADAHYRAEYSRRAADLDRRHNTVMNGIADQMGTVGERLGIDTATWKAPGSTFAAMAADIEAATEARVRAEYRAIEDDNRQLRLTGPRGLAAARTGLNGGMSNGGSAPASENDIFGRFLRG